MTEAARDPVTFSQFVADALGSIGMAIKGLRPANQLDSGPRDNPTGLRETCSTLTSALSPLDPRESLPHDIQFLAQDPARAGRRRIVAEGIDRGLARMSKQDLQNIHGLATKAYEASGVAVPPMIPGQLTPSVPVQSPGQALRVDLPRPQRSTAANQLGRR